MRFQKTIDIWSIPDSQVAQLQVGQWVSAGKADEGRQNCGRFLGVKRSGSVVVIWNGNVHNRKDRKAYRQAMKDYAKS